MNYLQIYKSLIELVSKANLTPLAQDNFVIQEDAYQRIADEENLDEVFLRYSYKAGTHDNDLPFEIVLTRELFAIGSEGSYFEFRYDQFDSPESAAQAILDSCMLFLNGQIRAVATIKGHTVKSFEQFLVTGTKQWPISIHLSRATIMSFVNFGNVSAVIFRNNIIKQQIDIPNDFFLLENNLTTAYESFNRRIDWGEPQPLDSKAWEKIKTEIIWSGTDKKPLEHPYRYALKQWETWLFTVIMGTVLIFLSIKLPKIHFLIQSASQIIFAMFVFYLLPHYARSKYEKSCRKSSK
jgi:hypothetical protein